MTVVVVGAGIGGLACALSLASRGIDTLVVERAATVGGKLREVVVDGARLDAGPTVLTMRRVFESLFADAGIELADRLTLVRATTLARHAWPDGSTLDLFADVDASAAAIARFAGDAEADGYRAFSERSRAIYRTLERPFLESPQPNPVSLAKRVGWRGLGGLVRISPFATMWSELSRYFRDPRLKQLFGRYATYCGSSPFAAPATLMLVAHVEQDGVWLVDGGMHAIAAAFADAIVELGGAVRCDAEVARVVVERGRVAAVVLANGERIAASSVVFAGDASAIAAGFVGEDVASAAPPVAPAARSLSAITWHLHARTRGFPLVRHNVFFSADSPREFAALFDARAVPDDPTVYVCAQDRGADEDGSMEGTERLMCLVNAPADADRAPLSTEAIEAATGRLFAKLAACGLVVDRAASPESTTTAATTTAAKTTVTTPTDFARLFPATGGALYGRATHGWSASFERPSSATKILGLYLAGGSVHPGPGLPMAALSGRLAADRVLADRLG